MRNFFIILACFAISPCHAQQLVLHHHFYTSHFNRQHYIPDSVVYDLSDDILTCTEHIKRKTFKPDPDATDYTSLKQIIQSLVMTVAIICLLRIICALTEA